MSPFSLLIHEHRYDGFDGEEGFDLEVGPGEAWSGFGSFAGPADTGTAAADTSAPWYGQVDWAAAGTATAGLLASILNATAGTQVASTSNAQCPGKIFFEGRCFATAAEVSAYAQAKQQNQSSGISTPMIIGIAAVGLAALLLLRGNSGGSPAPALSGYRRRRRARRS